jgi:hypothetical protein
MWELRRLTTLWASTACYRDSFTLFTYGGIRKDVILAYIKERSLNLPKELRKMKTSVSDKQQ